MSIIPSAHAWGWVDTLDLFIPISSVNDVIDQIGKIGTEEFNPAILKVMKILGPFFGNVIKKVGDSKSIDPILNLLPFFMILGEIAADEEARCSGLVIRFLTDTLYPSILC